MDCTEAHGLICAERDGSLEPSRRPALEAHVQTCLTCRRERELLASAATVWLATRAGLAIPDPAREWQQVRAHIGAGLNRQQHGLRPVTWLGWGSAVGAAAVLAMVAFVGWPRFHGGTNAMRHEVAQVESIEFSDGAASPMVFVDEETGWLVVWSVASGGSES